MIFPMIFDFFSGYGRTIPPGKDTTFIALKIGGSSSRLFSGSFTSEMDTTPSFPCCSNRFLIFSRMSISYFVYASNMRTLSPKNPFIFAIFYPLTQNYSMTFMNTFHLLLLILQGFGGFPFRHYL